MAGNKVFRPLSLRRKNREKNAVGVVVVYQSFVGELNKENSGLNVKIAVYFYTQLTRPISYGK